MSLTAAAFYILGGATILSAFFVIAARNPVHAVLWLIAAFFAAAGLFVLIGAEFLAMLLVVVYVGAVSVLFLFVVMMLDVDFVRLRQGFLNYLPLGVLIAGLLIAELFLVSAALGENGAAALSEGRIEPSPGAANNVAAIGRVLYTDYVLHFQLAGAILFIAMIGAIVLTLRERPGVRRQDVGRQVGRRPRDAVKLVDARPGHGLQSPE